MTRKAVVNRVTALTVLQGLILACTWIAGGVPHTRSQIFASILAHGLFLMNAALVWVIDRP